MIKFSIESQDVKNEQTQELRIGLRMSVGGVGVVTLMDNNEVDYCLLKLYPDGTFDRAEALPDDIGLQVNDEGQIKERN